MSQLINSLLSVCLAVRIYSGLPGFHRRPPDLLPAWGGFDVGETSQACCTRLGAPGRSRRLLSLGTAEAELPLAYQPAVSVTPGARSSEHARSKRDNHDAPRCVRMCTIAGSRPGPCSARRQGCVLLAVPAGDHAELHDPGGSHEHDEQHAGDRGEE